MYRAKGEIAPKQYDSPTLLCYLSDIVGHRTIERWQSAVRSRIALKRAAGRYQLNSRSGICGIDRCHEHRNRQLQAPSFPAADHRQCSLALLQVLFEPADFAKLGQRFQ